MQNLNLPQYKIGDKLIWNAPIPFEGYYHESKLPQYKGRIVYPLKVSDKKMLANHSMHLIRSTNSRMWVKLPNEYVLTPTEEELQIFNWDF